MTMSESQGSVSLLEMTRNPFENNIEHKLNYPGFSPSMFTAPRTPDTRKEKEFRWSIEQISRLYPVDMDEFPNQEYSSTYERDEDEQAAQNAINEYFSQDAIVPSPWTPNRSVKHVTFSPLPPDTQYIANECSMNSSYSSQNNSISAGKIEAGTQTALSFPWNVNLEELLGSAFQTFMYNDLNNSKDLSTSSLRRNLFPHDEETKRRNDINNNQQNMKIRSILKTSKSPTLTTSSPVNDKHSQSKEERSTSGHSTPCPDVSPIRTGHLTPLNKLKNSRLSFGMSLSSPMTSNVLESSGIERDLDMFPDISPIKDDKVESDNEENEQKEIAGHNSDSHCDDVEPLKLTAPRTLDDEVDGNGTCTYSNDDNDDSTSSHGSDDSEKPAKITMEDLANDISICDDQCYEPQDRKPPAVTMEDLQSPDDISMMKETDMVGEAEAMETSMTNILSSTQLPECKKQNDPQDAEEEGINGSDERLWKDRQRLGERFHMGFEASDKDKDLDDDLVIVKASAALRRADHFTQSMQDESKYGPNSKTMYNYSLSNINLSELPGQPVSMSTPLTVSPMRPRAFGSSFDDFDRFETQNKLGNSSGNMFLWNKEYEIGSSYHDNSVYHSRNCTKILSPVMEDVLRRKELLKSCLKEVQHSEWNAVTPTYKSPLAGKWRTPRTYPLSYADRKSLYRRPSYRTPDYIDTYSPQLYNNTSRYNSKRLSWPPSRSYQLKLHNSSRPLSPPNWPTTSKVYSTNPEGCVSRMPLPAPFTQSHFDSGFDEWKKSINRWENSKRIQSLKLKSLY